MNKISLLNQYSEEKVNICTIKKAIYCAKTYHDCQQRETGEPYYSHPLEVAYMVIDYLFTTDAIVISVLHDTIEDTSATKETLELLFNSNIASQVQDLTRFNNKVKISCAEMVKSLLYKKQDDLLLIKYFDRLHNMLSIQVKHPNKIKTITEETINIFLHLSDYLNIRSSQSNLLAKLCNYYK